jgi:hypothetical protein
MRSLRRSLLLLAVALLVRPATAAALQAAPAVQEPVDLDVIERIRDEGLNRSQIPELARHLTDVIGPRLTGSTGMRRANEWTAETLRGWGLANVVIEPWGEFGRGWENVRYAGRTLEPYVQPLSAHPIAWTGSTRGTATGPVVIVHADSVADLEPHRGKLRGAFVMTEAPEAREPEFEAAARRFTPEELLEAPEARDRPSPDEIERMRERFRRRRALQDSISEVLRGHNTLGDLTGTDLADEYVMIGAHLDSWHSGTGATDNAAGSIVMMEAMRILKSLGLEPRRTIRIALWSGEEQGLLGSRAWVERNEALGTRISAYLNVDNGTGRIRGIWTQGNAAVAPIFEQILRPLEDLGVIAVRHGNTGGTDHLSFDRAGIPGFNFVQDPIEYSTRTHHTHVDTFERLVLDDLKQAAVVVAYTAYHLAVREERIPRKPAAPEAAGR